MEIEFVDNEPANIKYAKQILALLEKDIIENRSRIMSIDVKRRELYAEEERLKEARYDLLKELSKMEMERCEPASMVLKGSMLGKKTFKGRLFREPLFKED